MQFNVLSTMPLWCRHGQSGSTDLADQPMQDLPQDHDGESTTRSVDLEARGSHDEVPKGLIGLSAHRRDDVMYMFTRRFRQQTAYCLDTKAKRVDKAWGEILQITARGGSGLDKLNEEFFDDMVKHYTMTLLTYQVEGLAKPNDKLLDNFLGTVVPKLDEEDARFLDAPREDWVMTCPMEAMKRLSKLVPEYEVGRFCCKPFNNGENAYEGFTSYDYPEKVFRAVVMTIFHLILVALVGVPVVIQALGILSMGGNAAMYLICLFMFVVLTQAVVSNESAQFLMSLAYAAVMATNLGRGC